MIYISPLKFILIEWSR